MRTGLALFLAAGASAAEVARRDVVVALELGDGGFAYQLEADIGSFSGDDAFERIAVARLGGRWAWASAGSPLAPLIGLDLTRLDAPMSGGGLSGYGAELAAGGTWAMAEPLALDLEGFLGQYRVNLILPGSGGTSGLSGDGSLQRGGVRARLSWHVARHWSVALEGGWMIWTADIAGDGSRTLAFDGSGPLAGLALSWRPSSRPGSIE